MINEHLEYLKEQLKERQKSLVDEKLKSEQYADLLVDGFEKIAIGFEKIAKFMKLNNPYIKFEAYEKEKISDIEKQISEIQEGLECLKKND
jgi:hypothetical protein